MFCEKCGKSFSSRGYLLAHLCQGFTDHIVVSNEDQSQIFHAVGPASSDGIVLMEKDPVLTSSSVPVEISSDAEFIELRSFDVFGPSAYNYYTSTSGRNMTNIQNSILESTLDVDNMPSISTVHIAPLECSGNAEHESFNVEKSNVSPRKDSAYNHSDTSEAGRNMSNIQNRPCVLETTHVDSMPSTSTPYVSPLDDSEHSINGDDSDADPTWQLEDHIDSSHKSNTKLFLIGECKGSDQEQILTSKEKKPTRDGVEPLITDMSESENEESSKLCKKIKKGVQLRREEKRKKDLGLPYTNRKGKSFAAKEFNPILKCCKKKCFSKYPQDTLRNFYSNFNSKNPELRRQILCERMKITPCKFHWKGRGTKGGQPHNRAVTVTYQVTIEGNTFDVCKEFFINLHGVTKNQLDLLIKKLNASKDGLIQEDLRGKHIPKNKLVDERISILDFINKYPRHESHYSRRDNADKIFLPSHLNITKMYGEYKKVREDQGFTLCAGYDVFRDVFNRTGYKFKQPYIDTCRKCDEFRALKKAASTKEEKERLTLLHDTHVEDAEKGYESKRSDKKEAKENNNLQVLVFDLQQVLSAPFLSTNIAYYKRLLSVYNLTIRACGSSTSSDCFMWHEVIGSRGADQIASCLFKKIMDLPDGVDHIITYSDTCGGQNRNINVAAMFLYAMNKKESLQIIDQKFLLPGHTRLECDSDHARIERAKKQIDKDSKIMVPRDWFQFVRMLRGKKKFNVVEMTREDFYSFSKLVDKSSNIFVKRKLDTSGQKVSWLKIKWIRYSKEPGILHFKYTLDKDAPFLTLDLRRGKPRGRPTKTLNLSVPLSYPAPLGINPKKKQDLLSILDVIDTDCHSFYQNLPTHGQAPEFDELDDQVDSEDDA